MMFKPSKWDVFVTRLQRGSIILALSGFLVPFIPDPAHVRALREYPVGGKSSIEEEPSPVGGAFDDYEWVIEEVG